MFWIVLIIAALFLAGDNYKNKPLIAARIKPRRKKKIA